MPLTNHCGFQLFKTASHVLPLRWESTANLKFVIFVSTCTVKTFQSFNHHILQDGMLPYQIQQNLSAVPIAWIVRFDFFSNTKNVFSNSENRLTAFVIWLLKKQLRFDFIKPQSKETWRTCQIDNTVLWVKLLYNLFYKIARVSSFYETYVLSTCICMPHIQL